MRLFRHVWNPHAVDTLYCPGLDISSRGLMTALAQVRPADLSF
jgi:hypothetical protein